jgi:hypothetical protein
METSKDQRMQVTGRPAGDVGNGLLVGLVALACPLLCLGPLLAAGLASTGIVHLLGGAPWPAIVAVVAIVLALGSWGVRTTRRRGAGPCCPPLPPSHHESIR